MFKFIFEILTDPLGLPIPWIWEYVILAIVGTCAYLLAFRAVGDMYDGGTIDGGCAGSFFHWLIRLIVFVIIWAIVYGIIALFKWVFAHWVIILSVLGGLLVIATVVILIIWNNNRKE